MELCLDVLAPLVHDWVLVKSDTTFGCLLQLLLDVSVGCQNPLEVVSGRVLPELLLPCPDILLLMKKEQLWPAS